MARSGSNGHDGKLIDTWNWKYKGVESGLSSSLLAEDDDPLDGAGKIADLVKDQVVPIEVRLLKKYNEEQLPRTENSVEFVVICRLLGLRLQGPDIEVLRRAMWSKLEKDFEIKWDCWYLIQIASARSFQGDLETGFALSQNTIYRGVAKDGTVLMREFDRGRTSSPWRYKSWPAEYEDRGGHVIACIPANDTNDQALNEFRARIKELQKRLSDLVKPKVIQQTLANLAQIGLPAPGASSDDVT